MQPRRSRVTHTHTHIALLTRRGVCLPASCKHRLSLSLPPSLLPSFPSFCCLYATLPRIYSYSCLDLHELPCPWTCVCAQIWMAWHGFNQRLMAVVETHRSVCVTAVSEPFLNCCQNSPIYCRDRPTTPSGAQTMPSSVVSNSILCI